MSDNSLAGVLSPVPLFTWAQCALIDKGSADATPKIGGPSKGASHELRAEARSDSSKAADAKADRGERSNFDSVEDSTHVRVSDWEFMEIIIPSLQLDHLITLLLLAGAVK